MPSDRLFPGADIHFKEAIDDIIFQIASEEMSKAYEKQRREAKQKR